MEEIEEDVEKEAVVVEHMLKEEGEIKDLPPLVVSNIAKKYATGKVALRGVSFFVEVILIGNLASYLVLDLEKFGFWVIGSQWCWKEHIA